MLFRPIVAMGEQWNVVFRAMASCERIFQALDWQEALTEPEDPKPLPVQLSGAVSFRNLNFSYRPGHPILKDVSFDIAPGERLQLSVRPGRVRQRSSVCSAASMTYRLVKS